MAQGGTPTPPGDDPGEPPADPPAEVLAALPRVMQLSRTLGRGRVAEHAMDATGTNLERPAFAVLITLHFADEPLRIKQIAEQMQVVQPHVTRQVQLLERRGLVRRTADPDDRRASIIAPTPEGSAAAERYATTLLGWFTQAIAHWPDQDRRDLGRLLSRLVDDVTTSLRRFGDEQED
ncbi:MarR family transcriptional regulator [Streptomyces sp. HNM0575]|uniref:MarR family winged helix-turn-helix transcriptional regulator n=1 Tax=Streptomyces sp. HNM0575 TaxID=2716338 RepID=UPI00145EC417|nr:MarR family transcriptional regulator [Streptomyces sp. HNM0575]NLU72482.1 MarR family transcriptional regulator [Streptomyces sp. HNM0575]